MKEVTSNWQRPFSLLCGVFLVFISASFTFAENNAKAATAKATKSKTAKAPAKTVPPAPVIDEATVQSSFEIFTQEWMKKLAEAEEYHRKDLIKISQNGEVFHAEYVGYLPQRFIEIKKTTSQETPFVGTLMYYERILRCTGKTKEAAIQGPFEQIEATPVKEIFRYTKGKWVY